MKTLTIDELLSFTREEFGNFSDKRAKNQSIDLGDIVQTGLSIFSLKNSSLLKNNNVFSKSQGNMLRIFKIANRPSDTQLRSVLDELKPIQIERVQRKIIQKLKKTNLLKQYEYFKGWKLLLVDGVHHYSSNTVCCEKCQKTNHKDGSISYSHSMLSSVIAHPEIKIVLPLCEEAIKNQDGATKNDCETNASKRLIEKIQTRHLSEKFIFVEDALYANGPNIREIIAKGNRFIIRTKIGSGAGSAIKQFENILEPGKHKMPPPKLLYRKGQSGSEGIERPEKQLVIENHTEETAKLIQRWSYVNGLYLNEANKDIEVNYIRYEEEHKKNKAVKKFEWITNIVLTKKNFKKVCIAGRARWKIENETFNTLKNQGYNFDHNYGHGFNHLCTNFALLMMIAFLIDQIQQLSNEVFQKAVVKEKRKSYFWSTMKSYFDLLEFDSMDMIYQAILHGIKVKFKIDYDSS